MDLLIYKFDEWISGRFDEIKNPAVFGSGMNCMKLLAV